jgi:hypothetical protein
MRSFILWLALGVCSAGLVGLTPSKAEAWPWGWRSGYASYYYPAYSYYSPGYYSYYPSYYYGPTYSSNYYTPGYASYYPGTVGYYYAPRYSYYYPGNRTYYYPGYRYYYGY